MEKGEVEKPYENVLVKRAASTVAARSSAMGDDDTGGGGPPRCPCCGDRYSRRLRQPRVLLSCLHPVCAACVRLAADMLVSLRRDPRTTAGGAATKREKVSLGMFLCPFCNVRTEVKKVAGGRHQDDVECRSEGASLVIGTLASRAHGDNTNSLDRMKKERDSRVLHSVLVELTSRLRVIENAVDVAEERRERIVSLVQRLEAGEADAEVLKGLRWRRLRAMNAVLERLCVLRQCRADLDFLCAGVASVFDAGGGDVWEWSEPSDVRDKIPLVASRLAEIGAVLGRLGPLPSLDREFDVESWRRRNKRRSRSSVRSGDDDGEGLRLCLDLSTPLYEKVVCRVPFVVLDGRGRRVDDDEGALLLSNLRMSLTVNGYPCTGLTIASVPNNASSSPSSSSSFPSSWRSLQFVPPFAGRAELCLSLGTETEEGDPTPLSVAAFPSSFKILPLSLESSENADDGATAKAVPAPRKFGRETELFAL